MTKVLFLTTAHHHDDDRIFHHQAKSLRDAGYQVKVTSLSSSFSGILDDIEIEAIDALHKSIREKAAIMSDVCEQFAPDIIICSEPLAVLAAKRYKRKRSIAIVYDVTEWYPSLRMIHHTHFLGKVGKFFKYSFIQLLAGKAATHFIFGEESKQFPLNYFFPRKPNLLLPYYPDLEFISTHIRTFDKNKITLCYTGRISEKDGIDNFFQVANLLQRRNPGSLIKLLIIGKTQSTSDQEKLQECINAFGKEKVTFKDPVPLKEFTAALEDADFCFDLRKKNFESTHCLPIKIFYYAGAGKPVMYSNMKATRRHLNVSRFGHLVEPEDIEQIVFYLEEYMHDESKYQFHAENAVAVVLEQYNWQVIAPSFLQFIRDAVR